MLKVGAGHESVSGLARSNRSCNIHRLPKPTAGLVHDVLENILLANAGSVTPCLCADLDEILVQWAVCRSAGHIPLN